MALCGVEFSVESRSSDSDEELLKVEELFEIDKDSDYMLGRPAIGSIEINRKIRERAEIANTFTLLPDEDLKSILDIKLTGDEADVSVKDVDIPDVQPLVPETDSLIFSGIKIFHCENFKTIFNTTDLTLAFCGYSREDNLSQYEQLLFNVNPLALSNGLQSFLVLCCPSQITNRRAFLKYLLFTIASGHIQSVIAAKEAILKFGSLKVTDILVEDIYDVFLNFGADVQTFCPLPSLLEHSVKKRFSMQQECTDGWTINLSIMFKVFREIIKCCPFGDPELSKFITLLLWMSLDDELKKFDFLVLIQECLYYSLKKIKSDEYLQEFLPDELIKFRTFLKGPSLTTMQFPLLYQVLNHIPVHAGEGRKLQKSLAFRVLNQLCHHFEINISADKIEEIPAVLKSLNSKLVKHKESLRTRTAIEENLMVLVLVINFCIGYEYHFHLMDVYQDIRHELNNSDRLINTYIAHTMSFRERIARVLFRMHLLTPRTRFRDLSRSLFCRSPKLEEDSLDDVELRKSNPVLPEHLRSQRIIIESFIVEPLPESASDGASNTCSVSPLDVRGTPQDNNIVTDSSIDNMTERSSKVEDSANVNDISNQSSCNSISEIEGKELSEDNLSGLNSSAVLPIQDDSSRNGQPRSSLLTNSATVTDEINNLKRLLLAEDCEGTSKSWETSAIPFLEVHSTNDLEEREKLCDNNNNNEDEILSLPYKVICLENRSIHYNDNVTKTHSVQEKLPLTQGRQSSVGVEIDSFNDDGKKLDSESKSPLLLQCLETIPSHSIILNMKKRLKTKMSAVSARDNAVVNNLVIQQIVPKETDSMNKNCSSNSSSNGESTTLPTTAPVQQCRPLFTVEHTTSSSDEFGTVDVYRDTASLKAIQVYDTDGNNELDAQSEFTSKGFPATENIQSDNDIEIVDLVCKTKNDESEEEKALAAAAKEYLQKRQQNLPPHAKKIKLSSVKLVVENVKANLENVSRTKSASTDLAASRNQQNFGFACLDNYMALRKMTSVKRKINRPTEPQVIDLSDDSNDSDECQVEFSTDPKFRPDIEVISMNKKKVKK